MKGQFIVIEGLEGAGKSTAIATVEGWFLQQNIRYTTTREPGGTPLAEQLREILKYHEGEERITEQSELFMMYAARSQVVENVIQPALDEGLWVLGDRHDLSSRAYQGGGREISMMTLDLLRSLTLGDFRPALTLYLDIDPEIGLGRARSRGHLDRIEQQQLAFFQRARCVYLAEQQADPTIAKIDAAQPLADVQADIITALEQFSATLI